MTNTQETTALHLATQINALAYDTDPYSYRDYVDEYCEGSSEVAIRFTWWDLLNRNTNYLLDWLSDTMKDDDVEQAAEAESLYDKLTDWIDDTRITKGE